MRDPSVAPYLAGWPRDGDFGVLADDEGVSVGAAWCRLFGSEPRGYGFVAPDVPELTIGVVTERRGRGIERLSLSVEADTPAIDLYTAVGFVEEFRIADSPTMVLDCRAT